MENAEKIDYSVVIAIFNEEKVLNEFYKRLTEVMESISTGYEIIFVDDGSRDKSLEILKSLHAGDQRIKIISFTKNFGHHIAITAGIDYAHGDAIILMDGDLQDPPEEIPKLIKKFKEGYDVVYADRGTRKDSFFKKMCSKIFHKIFESIGKVKVSSNAGVFRIISKKVANYTKSCREKSRFVTALIGWAGFSSVGVEIKRDERYAGESKYSFWKSVKLAVNAIVSFSNFPLHIATYTGFLIATLSFIIGSYMLIKKIFFGMTVLGYASVIVSLFFLGGVQLIIIGIIGEYISRIYAEVQERPMYIIKDEIGFDNISARK